MWQACFLETNCGSLGYEKRERKRTSGNGSKGEQLVLSKENHTRQWHLVFYSSTGAEGTKTARRRSSALGSVLITFLFQ